MALQNKIVQRPTPPDPDESLDLSLDDLRAHPFC
jgi:hypothetical protein